MDRKTSLLALYQKRSVLSHTGPLTYEELRSILQKQAVIMPENILEAVAQASMLGGRIHPELLIETAFANVSRTRSHSKEEAFLSTHCKGGASLPWLDFKGKFMAEFRGVYKAADTKRILALLAKFGTGPSGELSTEYFSAFISTSNRLRPRSSRPLVEALSNTHLRLAWEHFKSSESLVPSLTESFSIIESSRSTERSCQLRNKITGQALAQAFKRAQLTQVRDAFNILENPIKYRDPLLHRGFGMFYFKMLDRIRHTLQRCFSKWVPSPPATNGLVILRKLVFSRTQTAFNSIVKRKYPSVLFNVCAILRKQNSSIASTWFYRWAEASCLGRLQASFSFTQARLHDELQQTVVEVRQRTALSILHSVDNTRASRLKPLFWIRWTHYKPPKKKLSKTVKKCPGKNKKKPKVVKHLPDPNIKYTIKKVRVCHAMELLSQFERARVKLRKHSWFLRWQRAKPMPRLPLNELRLNPLLNKVRY